MESRGCYDSRYKSNPKFGHHLLAVVERKLMIGQYPNLLLLQTTDLQMEEINIMNTDTLYRE